MCNIKSLSFKITVGPCKLACLFLIFCHFGVIVLFYDCFVFNCCLFETQVNLGLNPQSCLYSAILGWKLPRGCIRNERVNNSISMLAFSIWIIWKTRTCCPFHQCYLLQCETLKTDERFVRKWEIQKQSGACECVASLVQKDHSFLLPSPTQASDLSRRQNNFQNLIKSLWWGFLAKIDSGFYSLTIFSKTLCWRCLIGSKLGGSFII